MANKFYNYKVVEKNVNGGGEDAFEYIKTLEPLTEENMQRFREILEILKKEHQGDDFDTFDLIYEACEIFEKRCSIRAVMDSCPYEGVIEF